MVKAHTKCLQSESVGVRKKEYSQINKQAMCFKLIDKQEQIKQRSNKGYIYILYFNTNNTTEITE